VKSQFLFVFLQMHLGMEAGIREDRKGLLSGLKPSMPFLFFESITSGS